MQSNRMNVIMYRCAMLNVGLYKQKEKSDKKLIFLPFFYI